MSNATDCGVTFVGVRFVAGLALVREYVALSAGSVGVIVITMFIRLE